MQDLKLQQLNYKIKRIKRNKAIGKILFYGVMLIIATAVLIKIDSVEIAQTDTLNTLMDVELKIDDLSEENMLVEEVLQSEEKTLPMDSYEPAGAYLGEYTITYYCGCKKCCGKTDGITKLGTTATAGRTVGADWNVIAPTTKIYIEGIGERVVEDTGEGIQGNHIDVFVEDHATALKLGRATRKVYEVE